MLTRLVELEWTTLHLLYVVRITILLAQTFIVAHFIGDFLDDSSINIYMYKQKENRRSYFSSSCVYKPKLYSTGDWEPMGWDIKAAGNSSRRCQEKSHFQSFSKMSAVAWV